MQDFLITLGDSFTYGEGLEYYLWKEKYSNSYDIYRPIEDNNFIIKRLFQSTNLELFNYRVSNRYSNLLNEKFGTELIIQTNNGGNNLMRLNDLDLLIELFKNEPNTNPKYCIFQFTHVCRDVEQILTKKHLENHALNTFGEEFCKKICGASCCKNILIDEFYEIEDWLDFSCNQCEEYWKETKINK
jgi:hypothetical protein